MPVAAPIDYVLVATVADGARVEDLRVKAIADLASGDYLLGCAVADQGREGDLGLLSYDDIGTSKDSGYVIGSTAADGARESDLVVIETPSPDDGCVDSMDPALWETQLYGTYDGTRYTIISEIVFENLKGVTAITGIKMEVDLGLGGPLVCSLSGVDADGNYIDVSKYDFTQWTFADDGIGPMTWYQFVFHRAVLQDDDPPWYINKFCTYRI